MDRDEAYIRETIRLAHEAVADGNTPFGSLLVIDETVIKESKNTTRTDRDITAHPELKLARWAARELDRDERSRCTMYTSTEPCEMCAVAIHKAELNRVVYCVSSESLANTKGTTNSGISCEKVINRKGGTTTVDGPVLEPEGTRIHEEFY